MTLRSFVDSHDRVWTVWTVSPERSEQPERRTPPSAGPYAGPERRRHHVTSEAFKGALRQGWLAFDCGEDKRRLAMYPDDWTLMTDAQLERLCEIAKRVAVNSPNVL